MFLVVSQSDVKTFDRNTLKMKAVSAIYVNNEQKAMFLVVSQSDVHFGFEHPFFYVPDWAPRKKFVHP